MGWPTWEWAGMWAPQGQTWDSWPSAPGPSCMRKRAPSSWPVSPRKRGRAGSGSWGLGRGQQSLWLRWTCSWYSQPSSATNRFWGLLGAQCPRWRKEGKGRRQTRDPRTCLCAMPAAWQEAGMALSPWTGPKLGSLGSCRSAESLGEWEVRSFRKNAPGNRRQ